MRHLPRDQVFPNTCIPHCYVYQTINKLFYNIDKALVIEGSKKRGMIIGACGVPSKIGAYLINLVGRSACPNPTSHL